MCKVWARFVLPVATKSFSSHINNSPCYFPEQLFLLHPALYPELKVVEASPGRLNCLRAQTEASIMSSQYIGGSAQSVQIHVLGREVCTFPGAGPEK